MKNKKASILLAFLLLYVFLQSCSVIRFSSVMAHSGVVLSAWTWNTPTIDGVIDEDEWGTAAKIDFNITTSSIIYNGTIYVMNDYNNLYLAARITDDDLGNETMWDGFVFFFNNDDYGGPEFGDDGLACFTANVPLDHFFYNNTLGWPSDLDYGGSEDGYAAVSGNGTYNFFEIMHPLDSQDDAYDFSLKINDMVGFCVGYADNVAFSGFWPPLGNAWHDIKIAAPFWQGDLVLSGNDVCIISGEFNINGSIIVTENATLVLRDAFLRFTPTGSFRTITLMNPAGGNPRLILENSIIDAGGLFTILLYGNSTAQINQLDAAGATWLWLVLNDFSFADVENSEFVGLMLYYLSSMNLWHSDVGAVHVYSPEGININDSSMLDLVAYYNSTVEAQDSTITRLTIHSSTRQTLISELKPSTFSYWNYLENCSVILEGGGYAPNVTLHNTEVGNWTLYFTDSQHTIIRSSNLLKLSLVGSSNAAVYDTHVYELWLSGSSRLNATTSRADEVRLIGSSLIWSVNSTGNVAQISGQAAIYVNWYLDVYVKDSLWNDVPSANVTVKCADGTVTAKGTTNMFGWVKLTVLASVINATGEFPQWPHTVSAAYGPYQNSTMVNVSGNRQATVVLSEFIVPEFSTVLPTMAMFAAAASAALFGKSKNSRKKR